MFPPHSEAHRQGFGGLLTDGREGLGAASLKSSKIAGSSARHQKGPPVAVTAGQFGFGDHGAEINPFR